MNLPLSNIDETAKTGRRETKLSMLLRTGQRKNTLATCGHAISPSEAPHSRCFDCWHRFFSVNPKLVMASFDFLKDGREAEIKAARGTRFLKMFKAFVLHVQSIAPIQAEDAVSAGD